MTQTEAYDLACTRWKEPAATYLGTLCIIGEWVLLADHVDCILCTKTHGVRVYGQGASWDEACIQAGLLSDSNIPIPTKRGVEITQSTFPPEPPVTGVRLKGDTQVSSSRDSTPQVASSRDSTTKVSAQDATTKTALKNLCSTYGCGAKKVPNNPFCPKCFEEHRDERDRPPPLGDKT